MVEERAQGRHQLRLVELGVTGFRSLVDVQGIPLRSQTILTGHNDCGKTAVLDAVAFLLDEPGVDVQVSDLSNFGGPEEPGEHPPVVREMCVEGTFELSAEEEQRLAIQSPVLLRRRLDQEGQVVLEARLSVPDDARFRGLDDMGLAELRELAAQVGVQADGRANAKASWLQPLQDHAAGLETVTDWAAVPAGILDSMPGMVYFRGGAAESPETVVRSILTAKLRDHAKTEATLKKITELEGEFSELLKTDAEKLRKRIEERCGLDSLTLQPRIQFKPSVIGVEMTASANGQQEVSLRSAGAGRSRRIALALWESTRELLEIPEAVEGQDVAPPHDVVIAYDEPDTHLDYEHQRRIMKMIEASSRTPNARVIVATHSLNLIDGVDIQDVVHLGSTSGRAEIQSLTGKDTDEDVRRFMSKMAASLGFRNSVLLHERCFIGVEGPTEYAAFPVLFKIAMGYPIQSAGIALWSCGGNDGALKFAQFLKDHKRTVSFIVDRDSKRDKAKFFNDDRLSVNGFRPQECIYLGDPNEFEDVFSGDLWAHVANERWPHKDAAQGRYWTAEEIDALRARPKFSHSLHSLLRAGSEQAPPKKEQLVSILVNYIETPADIPEALHSVFKKAISVAEEAGPHRWDKED
ncbi:AAA family ATPase [Streptomyces sp. NPDC059900]|uniref:AAA family ATPase n=1 Tax=Streptomyces sp. NPDC059900 TaxID=3155816 RepID=UPI0034275AEE